MIARKTGDSDDDADVMFGSDGASQIGTEVTLTKKDDEDELFNHLQYVLDKNDDAGNIDRFLLLLQIFQITRVFLFFLQKHII